MDKLEKLEKLENRHVRLFGEGKMSIDVCGVLSRNGNQQWKLVITDECRHGCGGSSVVFDDCCVDVVTLLGTPQILLVA